jgi:hypothetical protein
VADVAAVMDAIAGRDPLDCTSQEQAIRFSDHLNTDVKGMRIGYVPAFMEIAGLSPEIKRAIERALRTLEELGAELIPIELPHADAALAAYYVIGPCEAFSNLSRFDSVRYGYSEPGASSLGAQQEVSRAHGFGPEAIRRIMLGSYLLSSGVYEKYYYPAQQVRTLITQDYREAFGRCDALVLPVSPSTAFKFGEIADPTSMYLSDIFTIPLNIAGNGGMSLPIGKGDESGLPVGLQIIGPQFKDENIFRVASVLERFYGQAKVAPLPDKSDGVPDVISSATVRKLSDPSLLEFLDEVRVDEICVDEARADDVPTDEVPTDEVPDTTSSATLGQWDDATRQIMIGDIEFLPPGQIAAPGQAEQAAQIAAGGQAEQAAQASTAEQVPAPGQVPATGQSPTTAEGEPR